MGKIYGYARVSTKNQRLDRQIKNIEDYCKDKKIERIYRESIREQKWDDHSLKNFLQLFALEIRLSLILCPE